MSKFGTIKTIITSLLLTSMLASTRADDAPLVGKWAVAIGILTEVGCPSRSDMEHFYALKFENGDDEAAFAVMESKHCDIILLGTEVMVKEHSSLSRASCVRPRDMQLQKEIGIGGDWGCLWMLDIAIVSKAAYARLGAYTDEIGVTTYPGALASEWDKLKKEYASHPGSLRAVGPSPFRR